MSYIKSTENALKDLLSGLGYDLEKIELCVSNRPDLGEFQINDAMKLAKIYHKSPISIANEIVDRLSSNSSFMNVNIAGAGFINVSLSDEALISFVKSIQNDVTANIDKLPPKKVIIDYGGANAAKMLHVGHLRSPNIGEAIKRLSSLLGYEMLGDVHLGDSGAQSGMVVREMRERYKELPCFKEEYDGGDFELPIKKEDLNDIYPSGSKKAKESEQIMEECRQITFQIQNGSIGYTVLWNKIVNLSSESIKEIYAKLNANFELWEGEQDAYKYIPELLKTLEEQNLTYISEGALVMDVKETDDEKELPPILLVKNDGAYLYATTDLATILGRIKRFNPDEIWYTADNRQELHFKQVFRAAKKANIVNRNATLEFFGFGTMNGPDGKPFKTRDGGVMGLTELISLVKEETFKNLNTDIVKEEDRDKTAEMLAIAALKYADLLPYRNTDYVFDVSKFSDLDGKTGPYLLYSTIRMKSLLNKAKEQCIEYGNFNKLKNNSDREVILTLLNLPNVLNKSFEAKSLNELAEYIYKLTSVYNKFYNENKILTEKNNELKESWLVLSKVVYNTNMLLLNILGLNCPDKM